MSNEKKKLSNHSVKKIEELIAYDFSEHVDNLSIKIYEIHLRGDITESVMYKMKARLKQKFIIFINNEFD